jgi:GMP synthase (glutamine-hydrolysing)
VLRARGRFAYALQGVTDAEAKRRRFRVVYRSLLMRAAREFGATVVLQGTIAADKIESGATGGAKIKTHHNAGLDFGRLRQLELIAHLFKYEVRGLAQAIGLPRSVWNRQPFPGPGLFLRVPGLPATPKNVAVTRWADTKSREILARHNLYDDYSQSLVGYGGPRTVGVK